MMKPHEDCVIRHDLDNCVKIFRNDEDSTVLLWIFSTSLSRPDESCRLELNKYAAGRLGLTLLREAGVDSDICEDLFEKLYLHDLEEE